MKVELKVSRGELLEALRFAALGCLDNSLHMKFEFNGSAGQRVTSDKGRVQVELNGARRGGDLVACFDNRLIRETVEAMESEDLSLEFFDELEPLKVNCDSGTAVLMPMRVS